MGQLKDKSPYVILYTEEMIKDLLLNFQNHPDIVLGVDKTYNLGQVFVTTTVYKNKAVHQKKTKQCPIFFGPMLLHSNSQNMSFHCFFSHLAARLNKINKILIGTDEEDVMLQVIIDTFKSSVVHLLCTQHSETNSINYLKDKQGACVRDRKNITEEIFGDNGIVKSENVVTFQNKCEIFQFKWAKYSKFMTYCTLRLFKIILKKVCEPVWLHGAPLRWSNNNAESGNYILKKACHWKLHKLPELIAILYDVVKIQTMDPECAMIGTGNFVLAPEYSCYFVKPNAWADMISDQRAQKRDQFLLNRKKN